MGRGTTKKIIVIVLLVLGFSFKTHAQSAYGELRGDLILEFLENDSSILIDITFAKFKLLAKDNTVVRSTVAEPNGAFYFKNITPGDYRIAADMVNFKKDTSEFIRINSGTLTRYDIKLSDNRISDLKIVVIGGSRIQVLPTPPIVTEGLINSSSGPNVTDVLINIKPGVSADARGRLTIVGSRPDGNLSMVDGGFIRTRAVPNAFAIGSVDLNIGGIGAQFGDFTGGVINYSTRPIGIKKTTQFDVNSSSLFNKYHQNSFEFFTSAPLFIKNKGKELDSNGQNGEQIKLAYSLSGNLNYAKDPNPSAVGYNIINPDKIDEIIANPIAITESRGGLVPAGSLIEKEDIINVQARPDADRLEYNVQGKLIYNPNNRSRFTFYGIANMERFKQAGVNLFNYRNSPLVNTEDYLTYLNYQLDLPNPSIQTMLTKYHLSKANITFRADFQQSNTRVQDSRHREDIFDYGYVGEFLRFEAPVYTNVGDITSPNAVPKKFIDQNGNEVYLSTYTEQIGFADSAFRYIAGLKNAERANFTQSVVDFLENRGDLNAELLGSNLGLLNGNNPANIYGLWASPGQNRANFSKNQSTFISITGYGEATLNAPLGRIKSNNPHDFQFGMYFEQSFQRGYNLNANNLWLLMPQLANTHLNKLDLNNPILTYNADGVFTDTVKYNRIIDANNQNEFDKNLRNQLINQGAKDVYGNPINQSSIININGLKPEQLSLDMFSADELLNNGNSYVSYFGYDYLGNKISNKTDLDAYFNDAQNRAVGAFQPTYIAAWIQDQFDFKDLLFKVGLRMERYDANQPVLADAYSLFPIRTVAEVSSLNGTEIKHPNNISSDAKVYVDDVKAPTKVIGYREADIWYDANGTQIANSDILANKTSNGKIAPYLVDQNQKKVEATAFKDYEAKVYFLPRFTFSFPINSGLFFANYDVQTQRPNSGVSTGNISDYVFLENTNGGTIANPALMPRQKTSYEIGFRQMLTNPRERRTLYADIGMVGGYANISNDVNLFFYGNAYPISYTSYTNIDNSSIKNLRVEFNLRKSQNLQFSANYTLLYAAGTGSNANSSRALIQSNQPNLRTNLPLGDLDVRNSFKMDLNYSLGGGFDTRTNESLYIGPVHLKRALEYASFGANFTAISGLPYTTTINPVALGSNDRSQVKGNPFGSRLPYNYNLNLRVAKSFAVGNVGHKKLINIYLLVTNVLQAKNRTSVYSYSGLAEDDGFLSSPTGQSQIASTLNAEAYDAVYRAALQNPEFFRAPRMMQLGLRLNI